MNTEQLEELMLLMKKHNVEHLEVEGIKLSIKLEAPEIPKSKTTVEKLDKLAALPSPEELEMWSVATMQPDPAEKVLTPRKKVKNNGS